MIVCCICILCVYVLRLYTLCPYAATGYCSCILRVFTATVNATVSCHYLLRLYTATVDYDCTLRLYTASAHSASVNWVCILCVCTLCVYILRLYTLYVCISGPNFGVGFQDCVLIPYSTFNFFFLPLVLDIIATFRFCHLTTILQCLHCLHRANFLLLLLKEFRWSFILLLLMRVVLLLLMGFVVYARLSLLELQVLCLLFSVYCFYYVFY